MTDYHAFWRFLPEEAPSDADALRSAAGAGKGAFARALREARHRLGSRRTASLLRGLASEDRIGRPFKLLIVSPFQPRAIEDAIAVAFAIAGLAVEIAAVDGFAALGLADEAALAGADMALVPLLRTAGDLAPDARAVAEALSARCRAPILVAEAGGEAAPPAFGAGSTSIALPLEGAAIDARFQRTFGAIPTEDAADRLADAAAGFAATLTGTAPKLIVTDLDDTLWDGVAGEDGIDGIRLNEPYASVLHAFRQRGLVLAIASRNERADAEESFAAHPEWPLVRDDFAALALGWDGKDALVADVLRATNLGPEHMLFVDDDPLNCATVAACFPDADVRRFDRDAFASILSNDPLLAFAAPGDGDRTEQYRRREEVERLRADAPDVHEFLRRLRTVLTVVPLGPSLFPRAAELAGRVNQFALNDRRANVGALAERHSPFDFMVQLDDAFGAHGLVGLVLAHRDGGRVVLDAFFLSCRAFGRSVEDAMLAAIARSAARAGCDLVDGTIERLPRNEPARRFFARYLDAGDERHFSISPDEDKTAPEGVTILWAKATT